MRAHRQHARRARGDAELAALAHLDRDRDGALALHDRSCSRVAALRSRRPTVVAGADRGLVRRDVLRPVRRDRLPACPRRSASSPTRPLDRRVRAGHHHRPAERVAELVGDVGGRHPQHPVAATRRARSRTSRRSRARARRRGACGSIGAQNLSCIPIADQVCETSGGESSGPSPIDDGRVGVHARASRRRRRRRASRGGPRASRRGRAPARRAARPARRCR